MHKMRRAATAVVLGWMGISVSGCSKPPGEAPMQGDFPVLAVVARAEVQSLDEVLSLVGTLQAREDIEIVSEIDAVVEEIAFTEGQQVEQGAILFRMDEAKLKARHEEAEARFRLAKTNFERGRGLLENQTISQQEYDQVQSAFEASSASLNLAAEELNDAVIIAPFSGVAGERKVSTGQFVNRGTVLGSLVAIDTLEAVFDVPERYLDRLITGSKMSIRTAAYGDEAFAGTLFFVAPRVDERDRTVRVKAQMPNADRRLKPGLFGSLELVLSTREKALVIPEACVKHRGDSTMVLALDKDSRAEFRPVQLGVRLKGLVEVLDGLTEGERVVVEGHQKMGPGSLVMISPKSERYGVQPAPLPESGPEPEAP